jgi:hypothetical protein
MSKTISQHGQIAGDRIAAPGDFTGRDVDYWIRKYVWSGYANFMGCRLFRINLSFGFIIILLKEKYPC